MSAETPPKMEISYCPWRSKVSWSTVGRSDWTELQTTEFSKPLIFKPKEAKFITDAIKSSGDNGNSTASEDGVSGDENDISGEEGDYDGIPQSEGSPTESAEADAMNGSPGSQPATHQSYPSSHGSEDMASPRHSEDSYTSSRAETHVRFADEATAYSPSSYAGSAVSSSRSKDSSKSKKLAKEKKEKEKSKFRFVIWKTPKNDKPSKKNKSSGVVIEKVTKPSKKEHKSKSSSKDKKSKDKDKKDKSKKDKGKEKNTKETPEPLPAFLAPEHDLEQEEEYLPSPPSESEYTEYAEEVEEDTTPAIRTVPLPPPKAEPTPEPTPEEEVSTDSVDDAQESGTEDSLQPEDPLPSDDVPPATSEEAQISEAAEAEPTPPTTDSQPAAASDTPSLAEVKALLEQVRALVAMASKNNSNEDMPKDTQNLDAIASALVATEAAMETAVSNEDGSGNAPAQGEDTATIAAPIASEDAAIESEVVESCESVPESEPIAEVASNIIETGDSTPEDDLVDVIEVEVEVEKVDVESNESEIKTTPETSQDHIEAIIEPESSTNEIAANDSEDIAAVTSLEEEVPATSENDTPQEPETIEEVKENTSPESDQVVEISPAGQSGEAENVESEPIGEEIQTPSESEVVEIQDIAIENSEDVPEPLTIAEEAPISENVPSSEEAGSSEVSQAIEDVLDLTPAMQDEIEVQEATPVVDEPAEVAIEAGSSEEPASSTDNNLEEPSSVSEDATISGDQPEEIEGSDDIEGSAVAIKEVTSAVPEGESSKESTELESIAEPSLSPDTLVSEQEILVSEDGLSPQGEAQALEQVEIVESACEGAPEDPVILDEDPVPATADEQLPESSEAAVETTNASTEEPATMELNTESVSPLAPPGQGIPITEQVSTDEVGGVPAVEQFFIAVDTQAEGFEAQQAETREHEAETELQIERFHDGDDYYHEDYDEDSYDERSRSDDEESRHSVDETFYDEGQHEGHERHEDDERHDEKYEDDERHDERYEDDERRNERDNERFETPSQTHVDEERKIIEEVESNVGEQPLVEYTDSEDEENEWDSDGHSEADIKDDNREHREDKVWPHYSTGPSREPSMPRNAGRMVRFEQHPEDNQDWDRSSSPVQPEPEHQQAHSVQDQTIARLRPNPAESEWGDHSSNISMEDEDYERQMLARFHAAKRPDETQWDQSSVISVEEEARPMTIVQRVQAQDIKSDSEWDHSSEISLEDIHDRPTLAQRMQGRPTHRQPHDQWDAFSERSMSNERPAIERHIPGEWDAESVRSVSRDVSRERKPRTIAERVWKGMYESEGERSRSVSREREHPNVFLAPRGEEGSRGARSKPIVPHKPRHLASDSEWDRSSEVSLEDEQESRRSMLMPEPTVLRQRVGQGQRRQRIIPRVHSRLSHFNHQQGNISEDNDWDNSSEVSLEDSQPHPIHYTHSQHHNNHRNHTRHHPIPHPLPLSNPTSPIQRPFEHPLSPLSPSFSLTRINTNANKTTNTNTNYNRSIPRIQSKLSSHMRFDNLSSDNAEEWDSQQEHEHDREPEIEEVRSAEVSEDERRRGVRGRVQMFERDGLREGLMPGPGLRAATPPSALGYGDRDSYREREMEMEDERDRDMPRDVHRERKLPGEVRKLGMRFGGGSSVGAGRDSQRGGSMRSGYF